MNFTNIDSLYVMVGEAGARYRPSANKGYNGGGHGGVDNGTIHHMIISIIYAHFLYL